MLLEIVNLIYWLATTLGAYFVLLVAVTATLRMVKVYWWRRTPLPVSGQQAVLITGATSGIGLALAKHLYKLGYSVVVGYFNAQERGYQELKQLGSSNGGRKVNDEQRILFVELDVRSEESIKRAYESCESQMKENKLTLWGLVNNAGVSTLQNFAWLQRRAIKGMVETNLLGTMLMTREFLPMIVQSRGRIVNVSSGLALAPGPAYATYGSTKAAQVFFTTCINAELSSPYGVRAIAILPHNFIKNTSIGLGNVKNLKAGWDELRPVERNLYKSEFDNDMKKAAQLDRFIRNHQQLAALNKNSNKRKVAGEEKPSFIAKMIKSIVADNEALSLEETGVLEKFEDALRLPYPPEFIFAGDNVWDYLVGSVLLSVPTTLAGYIGLVTTDGLYR